VIDDPVPIGEMVQVQIHSALTHDLVGKLVETNGAP